MEFEPTSHALIGAAIEVHRALGPGLLESAYQRCLETELRHRGLPFDVGVPTPVLFRGERIPVAYRADLVLSGEIVVEVKAVQALIPIHHAQVMTYLKLTGLRVGFLLNFNVPLMRDGIIRIVM